jgi:hypothetical protein
MVGRGQKTNAPVVIRGWWCQSVRRLSSKIILTDKSIVERRAEDDGVEP